MIDPKSATRASRSAPWIIAFVAGVALAFCVLSPAASAEEHKMKIETEEAARAAAVEKFNAVYPKLFAQNPLDKSYVPIAPLADDAFRHAEAEGGIWTLRHEPLAGLGVVAKVSEASGLVEFELLGLSTE